MTEDRDYRVGDVVVGTFACLLPERRRPIRVLVTSRYEDHGRAGFIGTALDRRGDEGTGGWGWDSEITEVRPVAGSAGDPDA